MYVQIGILLSALKPCNINVAVENGIVYSGLQNATLLWLSKMGLCYPIESPATYLQPSRKASKSSLKQCHIFVVVQSGIAIWFYTLPYICGPDRDSNSQHDHYVIKFVSDLRQVCDFLQFPPPIKLIATI